MTMYARIFATVVLCALAVAGCGSTAAPPAGTPASSPLASSPDSPTSSTVIGSGDQSASPPRLNASASITGLVTYADGRPVIGAVVSLSSEAALAIPEIGVLTGSDGRYAWPSLSPARYTVTVTMTDGGVSRTGSADATVLPGRPAIADLILR